VIIHRGRGEWCAELRNRELYLVLWKEGKEEKVDLDENILDAEPGTELLFSW
jgi:hypothetical protein